RGRAVIAGAGVAVLGPPVVGAWNGVGIFDFVYGAAKSGHGVVWRHGGVAVSVAKPDGIAEKEHDFVQPGAAHGGLVVVVAHGVVVRQELGIGCVALQHVVVGHRRCAFAGGDFARSVVGAEVCWLGYAVDVRADG